MDFVQQTRHAKLILEKVQLLSAESMLLEVGINDGKGGTRFFPFQKSSGCLGWKLKGTRKHHTLMTQFAALENQA